MKIYYAILVILFSVHLAYFFQGFGYLYPRKLSYTLENYPTVLFSTCVLVLIYIWRSMWIEVSTHM
jgi:hypothetical protein